MTPLDGSPGPPYSVAPTRWLVPGGPSVTADGDPQLLPALGLDAPISSANTAAAMPTATIPAIRAATATTAPPLAPLLCVDPLIGGRP
jgi:hypothetical protein